VAISLSEEIAPLAMTDGLSLRGVVCRSNLPCCEARGAVAIR